MKTVNHKITTKEIGKDAVCPVTKQKFNITAQTDAVEYCGEVYYFCCPVCKPKFKKEPGKYKTE